MPKVPGGGAGEDLSPVEPSKLLAKLPTLNDVLIQPAYKDGVTKGERGLLVFLNPGFTRVLLKLANPPLKLSAAGKTFDDAVAALELLLKSPDCPWQQDDRPEGGAKKSKK